jgi:hypothetical protein
MPLKIINVLKNFGPRSEIVTHLALLHMLKTILLVTLHLGNFPPRIRGILVGIKYKNKKVIYVAFYSWAEMRLISTTFALLGGLAIGMAQRKLSKLIKRD